MNRRATLSFDANAAAPVLPQAWAAYVAASQHVADPQASHAAGRAARAALEASREQVAAFLGAQPSEIFFTSGGTESDGQALLGALQAMERTPLPHTVTSVIEHAAVTKTVDLAAQRGLTTVGYVPVPRGGEGSVDAVLAALTPATKLLSWLMASNETGVVQPVASMAQACRDRGILFHTDAVQAVGRMPIDVASWPVDMLSFSGHKLGAVGGIGVLYRRSGVPWSPLLTSGEVPNVAGAASLAAALQAVPTEADLQALAARRDAFERSVQQAVREVEIIGQNAPRLPNTSCLRFAGCPGDGLLMALDIAGFAVSTGSACSSGSVEPSPILLGMGLTPKEALETLRVSLGRDTRAEELAVLAQHLSGAVRASLGNRF